MTLPEWRVPPGGHIYVDESTRGDYLLMCAVITNADAPRARAAMRRLLLPGSERLHMRKEAKRAGVILPAVVALDPKVVIYRVSRTVSDLEARRACVVALAGLACSLRADRVVFEAIDSLMQRDRSWTIEGARRAGHAAPPFTYSHQRAKEEPLLWISDAVGWAWARGGDHRRAVTPVTHLIDL